MMKYLIFTLFALITEAFEACTPVFKEKPRIIKKIDLDNNTQAKSSILIYKSESNATTAESIQVRVKKDNKEKIYAVFEKYDLLLSYYSDNINLYLVLQDTSSWHLRTDTMMIRINELTQ